MSYSATRPLSPTQRPRSEVTALANYVLLSHPDDLVGDDINPRANIQYSHPVHGQGILSFPDVLVQSIGRDQFLTVPICYANENGAIVKQSSVAATPLKYSQTRSPATPARIKSPPPLLHFLGSEGSNSVNSSFSLPKSEVNTTTARPTFNAKPISIPVVETASADGSIPSQTSVGLRLQGRKIEHVIPGGPAFLTGKLKEHDEIIAVDGEDLHDADAAAAIIGDDSEATVVLTVHTPLTGFVFDVEVVRISKASVNAVSHIFESLALLKINSMRAERPDDGPGPGPHHPAAPAQISSRQLADLVWQKTSDVILDMFRDRCKLRKRVEMQAGLYADVRRHLDASNIERDRLLEIVARSSPSAKEQQQQQQQ
eukprot:CAMPEP_0172183702 /NCGR_PEP_ID=MMETSP1050-20130122/19143_1 /TAXON_ID=233186 /ORGANISM="Cryptomonas curvata, Strain CCAP979/52" /LENGTH=370 /DNA_ID=CAMNT_0012857371 /DNA_START=56 /DNA_END=1165 /DNA_ORIENTATION=-